MQPVKATSLKRKVGMICAAYKCSTNSNPQHKTKPHRHKNIPAALFSVYNPGAGVSRPVQAEGLQFRAGKVFRGKRIYFKPIYGKNPTTSI
jgi:hypothetical protein